MISRVAKKIPHNKKDLRQCLRAKDCKPFRAGQGVHVQIIYSCQVVHRITTTQDGWTVQRQQVYPWSTASRVTVRSRIFIDHKGGCYGDRYVMVKRSPHLPRFYEAFVNYGKDKISWIENLRYIGYKFGVVTQSFATDIPHPKYIVSTREEGIDQRGSMTGQRR